MIIEFTAIPGAGKTFLTVELSNYLKKNLNIECKIFTRSDIKNMKHKYKNKIFQKLYMISLFVSVIDIDIIKLLIIYIKKKDKISVKRKRIIYILSLLSNYKIIEGIEKNRESLEDKYIFILDEGLLHLANIYIGKFCQIESIIEYFSLIKRSRFKSYVDEYNILIFVDSSVEENIDRINARAQGWPMSWRKFPSFEKETRIEEFLNSYNVLKKYISKDKSDFISINNIVFKCNYDEEFYKVEKLVRELFSLNLPHKS